MHDREIASATDGELERRRLFLIDHDDSLAADEEIEAIEREMEAREMDRHDASSRLLFDD